MFGWLGAEAARALTAESFKALRIFGQLAGQELQGDQATEFTIFGLVDHSHHAAPNFSTIQ